MPKTTQPICPRCSTRPQLSWDSYCRTCRNEYRRAHYRKNHEANKRQVRVEAWKRQGIDLTWDEYETLLDQQDGRCAICNQPPDKQALHVDHCHTTGKIRALLCRTCNVALGAAQDSPELLRSMADYLETHSLTTKPIPS